MAEIDLLAPGVIETGLMSIVSCPICAENLRAALNRKDLLLGDEAWQPKPCPEHDQRIAPTR